MNCNNFQTQNEKGDNFELSTILFQLFLKTVEDQEDFTIAVPHIHL